GKPAPAPRRNPASQTPGLSDWRRGLVGDLTSTLNLAATPDSSVPAFLSDPTLIPNRADPAVLTECIITGTPGSLTGPTEPIVMDPAVPANPVQPTQEALPAAVRRPSGVCAATTTPGGAGQKPPLPDTSAPDDLPLLAIMAGAALALGAWWAGRTAGVDA